MRISTIEEAQVPSAPVSPNVTRNLALGLLLGLTVGAGAAVLRFILDTRLRFQQDVERVADVPVLAGILTNLTQRGTYARQAVLSDVDVIESASVLDEVIEDLELDMTIGELRGIVSANSPTNSVLINIDVTGPDRIRLPRSPTRWARNSRTW